VRTPNACVEELGYRTTRDLDKIRPLMQESPWVDVFVSNVGFKSSVQPLVDNALGRLRRNRTMSKNKRERFGPS
jgi:hypothetical protein